MDKFSKKIVAFVDVLGFKKKIESITDTDTFEALFKTFDTYSKNHGLINYKGTSYNMTRVSDSIVFSSNISVIGSKFDSDLSTILSQLAFLQIDALSQGFLLRGGVTYGEVIHNKKNLYGKAYQQAYFMEENIAIYPRIIVDANIFDNFTKAKYFDEEDKYIKSFLKKDFDGQIYIDYFSFGYKNLLDNNKNTQGGDFMKLLNETVEKFKKEIDDSNTDLRVKQKYLWFVSKTKEFKVNLLNGKVD